MRTDDVRPRRWVMALALCLSVVTLTAGLQGGEPQSHFYPNRVGSFQDKDLTFDILTYFGRDLNVPLDEVRRFRPKVQAIYDIVRKHAVFNPPTGFEARAGRQWRGWERPAGAPLQGDVSVVFYYFINVDGKPSWGGEANTSVSLRINPSEPMPWNPFIIDPDGTKVWNERPVTSRVKGVPVYDEDTIFLCEVGPAPWIPATREQYLTTWLHVRAAEIQKMEADIARLADADPYAKWLAERPTRLQNQEEVYQRIKKTNLDQAEALRAQMQKMEAEMEARLKKMDVKPTADTAKSLQMLRDGEAAARRRLEALTPEQRKMPAFYQRDEWALGDGLVRARTSESHALVVVNPALYDRTRPASDIHLIVVQFVDFRGLPADHIGRVRLLTLRDTMDWPAVSAVMKR
jgi:hypothetical protein